MLTDRSSPSTPIFTKYHINILMYVFMLFAFYLNKGYFNILLDFITKLINIQIISKTDEKDSKLKFVTPKYVLNY